jgi:hypothetical protein
MEHTEPSLNQIAADLMALGGHSVSGLARSLTINRPNLTSWLLGRKQVFANDRELKICDALGWRHHGLRRDMVHRWQVGADLTRLRNLLHLDGLTPGEHLLIREVRAPGNDDLFGAYVLSELPHYAPKGEGLVILLRRTLERDAPPPITPETLGMGVMYKDHVEDWPYEVGTEEYQRWWASESAEPRSFDLPSFWRSCDYHWVETSQVVCHQGLSRTQLAWLDLQRQLEGLRRFGPQEEYLGVMRAIEAKLGRPLVPGL